MSVRQEEVIESVSQNTLTTPLIGIPDANGSIWIPLDKLKDSPKNVRTVPHSESHVKTLAALIHAHRQMYPLVVEAEIGESGEPTGFYLVTAGKGRRLAQLERVKLGQIEADHPIWCLLGSSEQSRELSIADNIHAAMHPADEFAAFKALLDEGRPIEDVAARFSVSPLVVQRRLKLANVAPEFIAMFREDVLSLEHMMAFALTDDHEQQRAAWATLPKGHRTASADWLRQALVADELPLSSALAKFVGAAYEKAGGAIRRDLFSDDERGYIIDAPLLARLATEKLEKAVTRLKKDGCAWAEARLRLDYSELQTFGQVESVQRDYTAEEGARIQEIAQEREQLEAQAKTLDEGNKRFEELNERLSVLEEEADAIEAKRLEPDPEQQRIAGAIATIDHNGKLRIERGLLLPEDKKRIAKQKKAAARGHDTKGAAPNRSHSAVLLRELTAQQTLALQAVLADRSDIALVALTHRLIRETFSTFSRAESVVQVATEHTSLEQYAEHIKEGKAYKALAERKAALKARLPRKPDALLGWLLKQPQSEVLELLAFCVALTVNGVRSDEDASPVDALGKAVGLDMREWWQATAKSYFGRVSKAQVIKAVSEAVSPEASAALQVLKKKDAAHLAEQRIAGTGWLPALLRTV